MAARAAPPSASVAGNVVGTPGPGVASNTARISGRSTTAWPAIVSITAIAATSTVWVRRSKGLLTLEPGQSFHQNATIATPASANVDIGPSTSSEVAVLPVPS